VIRLVYNLLWPVGLLFFLPGYLGKMFRRGGYREKFGQRLGFYDGALVRKLAGQQSTWLHAVSVGEVAIALKLARALRKIEPDLCCVLTTTTTTGFSFAGQNAPPWIEVMYMPLDFWPIMKRAFGVIRPARIILVEAEIWPNLVARAVALHVAVALVNARLSPRSEARFGRFRRFVAPMFRKLDLISVPERRDAERWMALGVEQGRIRHTGSIKYDPADFLSGAPAPRPQVFNADDPILLGGSTHRGEEETLGQVFVRLRLAFPFLRLFIAPRHVERVREIRSRLQGLGLRVELVSEIATHRAKPPDCVLLDKTGELQRWYAIATVAFVGKSLTAHGGQNPVEPIVAGVPVLFGPHMENFANLARELVEKNGALQVKDAGQLEETVRTLLRNEEARRTLVSNAEQVLSEHRGATGRTAQLIHQLRVSSSRG
jgi:3-deoxy-D-manno-octulosonic-acid transferase